MAISSGEGVSSQNDNVPKSNPQSHSRLLIPGSSAFFSLGLDAKPCFCPLNWPKRPRFPSALYHAFAGGLGGFIAAEKRPQTTQGESRQRLGSRYVSGQFKHPRNDKDGGGVPAPLFLRGSLELGGGQELTETCL